MMKKVVSILLLVLMVLASIPKSALAASPSTGAVVNGQWKMTVANIDLLTISTVPSVERKVLIDSDNIWPKTDMEKEEFTVPIGTIVTYQAVPNPMDLADFGICKLSYVRTQNGLDFYSEYNEVDEETGECYGTPEQIYFFKVADGGKNTSFTFTEVGVYGVNAAHLERPGDEGPEFPNSTYLVINVVDNSSAPVEKPSSWAEIQVSAAIDENLVPQSLQSKYTQATTRAEFCALAVALYEDVKGEITGRRSFTDTNDVNVEKMAAIGVVAGTNSEGTLFSPNSELTREQAATMLARLANAIGKPLPKQTSTATDKDSFSSWAAESIGQVQAVGVMSSTSATTNVFSPKSPYTREQSIVTILRLFEFITFAG